jgi:hypothetical protein
MCRASKEVLMRIKDPHRDNSVDFLPDLQSQLTYESKTAKNRTALGHN